MISWEDEAEACAQPSATLVLAFGVGAAVGAAWVLGPVAVAAWRHLHG